MNSRILSLSSHLPARQEWPGRLSLLSGVLIGLSYPPLKLGFLAWIGLIPLLRVLDHAAPKHAFRYGLLGGMGANLIAVYWLTFNSGTYLWAAFLSMVGAVLYLALFWGIIGYAFAWFHSRTGKGFFLLPFFWVSVEYLISFGTLGFPWISLATTQVEYLPLIQMVEVTGIYGVTFWVVSVNVLIYLFVFGPSLSRNRIQVWGAVMFLTPWILGGARFLMLKDGDKVEPSFRVSLVQPNVGPHEKWRKSRRNWNFEHLDSLFVEAAYGKPDLIVWPESATPAYLRKNARRLRQVRRRVNETGVPLLTGAIDWEYRNGRRMIYNGALLIGPRNTIQVYHKIHLVPFGEYIPLSQWFEVLDKLNLGQGNFDFGQSFTVYEVDSLRFSTVICFESIFPQLVREFVRRGAEFLVILVNDGWYGKTSEPYQHASIARFRAVEYRMPVIRCANTGISAVYDKTGKMKMRLSLDTEGIITAGIFPRQVLTFYARFGDVFSKMCLLIVLLYGGWLCYRSR